MKWPLQVDSKEVLKVKTWIRYSEARSAARVCGADVNNLHFLDMPFYQTGESIECWIESLQHSSRSELNLSSNSLTRDLVNTFSTMRPMHVLPSNFMLPTCSRVQHCSAEPGRNHVRRP